jgi:NAD(P)-dependent dehydrogenase (short-subunit alcohol dehydrogenase family)
VLLGCRSEERARDAIDRIRVLHPEADLAWVPLDLARLGSLEETAEIVKEEPRLDVLLNNAGLMVPSRQLTGDGFELHFQVHHLGHFALTGRLLDKLAQTPGARIVNVSSKAHAMGQIDFDDPNAERSFQVMGRYAMSKAANLYFTFELARRLEKAGIYVTAVACHPGTAETEIARWLPRWIQWLAPLARPLLNSAAEGALPALRAATDPDARPTDFYGPTRRWETARGADHAAITEHVRDEAVGARLWQLSVDMTGVSYLMD